MNDSQPWLMNARPDARQCDQCAYWEQGQSIARGECGLSGDPVKTVDVGNRAMMIWWRAK